MVSVIGLSALNLLMLWGLDKTFFWRQLLFWIIGIPVFLLARSIGTKNLFSLSKKVYFFILAFLALPLFLGVVIRGSARWIGIAGFSLQPSELVKPFLIGVLSWQLAKGEIKKFSHFLLLVFLIIIPCFFILTQPDLGSAGLVFITLISLLFISNQKRSWWLPLIFISIILLIIGWSRIFQPYQIDRINSFLNPQSDPLGKSYNIIQSKLAIGSGGLFGRGFGQGRQTQLSFLPEKHTDFIFSAIGEELGFLGILFTLGFYFWLFWWMLKKISLTKDRFDFYLKIGIFIQLFLQTIINIAVNLQLFPAVGIPLPLVSYGGSSLLSTILSLGLFSL